MILQFDPAKIPRTMPRELWYETWRWQRIINKRLMAWVEENRPAMIKIYEDTIIYGNARHHLDENHNIVNDPPFVPEEATGGLYKDKK